MKKTIVLVLTFAFLLLPLAVLAQSPTPATGPEGITPERNQIEKIQEIREAVKEKVREKIEEVSQGRLVAYVGTISQLNEPNFTLETRKGTKTIQTSQQTKFVGSARRQIEFADLEVDDYLIVIGYLSNEVVDARRIIVTSKPKPIIREVAFGQVTDISEEEELITVKNIRREMTYMVTTTSKTIITKKVDGKMGKVGFEDIAINDRVLVIGTASENEEKIITARLIHVIPGRATGQQTSPTPTETE